MEEQAHHWQNTIKSLIKELGKEIDMPKPH